MNAITHADHLALDAAMDDAQTRPLPVPWSEMAEQSVLGAVLFDNRAWDAVADILQTADFWSAQHRTLWDVVGAMVNANKPADILTVHDRLQAIGKAEECGGLVYLNALQQCVASAANCRRHAEIVREKAMQRALMRVVDEAGEIARDQARDPREKAMQIASLVDGLEAERDAADEPVSAADLAVRWIDHLNDRANGEIPPASETGLTDLDEALNGGLQPGRVYVIAARPSVGKSALAMQIALHRAQAGDGVLILSQEMDDEECHGRLVSNLARVDYSRLCKAQLADSDWGPVAEANEAIARLPLWIMDAGGLTLQKIRNKAMGKRKQGLKLLVIDYLQLCSGSGPAGRSNRNSELEEISRGVKNLARQIGISVLLLSQLSRDVEKRQSPEPQLSDLRDSGAIEQDADVVAFLWPVRELGLKKVVGLSLAKNRQGRQHVKDKAIPLEFHGWHQRWVNSEADITPGSLRAPKNQDFE